MATNSATSHLNIFERGVYPIELNIRLGHYTLRVWVTKLSIWRCARVIRNNDLSLIPYVCIRFIDLITAYKDSMTAFYWKWWREYLT